MSPVTLIGASLVFPSFQMQETGLEGFGVETVQLGSNVPFEFGELISGFGIQNRVVIVHPNTKQPLLGTTSRTRFRVDEGQLTFDDVLASPGVLYALSRPEIGTSFDFGLGPFQSELQLLGRDTGTAHVRVFLPVTLNPVGLANTDQDTDNAIKYVFRAGLGAGADATFAPGTKLLLGARAQGDYRYTYRAGEQSLTHNRGDVEWLFDVGIGARTSDTTAVMAMFFFQDWRQWTYDGLIDGVTRGNQVIGGRLTFRTYSGAARPTSPPPPPSSPPPPPTPPPTPTPSG